MPIEMKLVRDKIPELMKNDGQTFEMYIASDNEIGVMLDKKLREECEEAIREPGSTEELADILEVIYARAHLLGVSPGELEIMRYNKLHAKGGFDLRQVVKFDK